MIKVLIAVAGAFWWLASPVAAQTATPWCQIDDPAAWRLARQEMIAAGQRDLDTVPCPEILPATTLPQELVLPMPCGRAMVFRRVDVPVNHGLDQIVGQFGRVVDLQAETPQSVLSNGAWRAPVSGAFTLDPAGQPADSLTQDSISQRAYYIGKYELTAPQWQIFRAGLFALPAPESEDAAAPACAPFTAELAAQDLRTIPAAGGLSWFDAVDFTRAYSGWLIARDRDRMARGLPPDLPWEQGATGWLRLPTEAEWEFAARGGAGQVSEAARSQRYPTIRDPDTAQLRQATLSEICAPVPAKSDQLVGPVGMVLPNVLGLYDVLCNAEEIVLDLFRPTRPDGLGGMVGGVTTKGGTSARGREANTVGRRSETAALFTSQGEGATQTMGLRVLIGAPVFVGRRDDSAPYSEGLPNQPFETALMAAREGLLASGVGLAEGNSDVLAAEVNSLRRQIAEGNATTADLTDSISRLQIELDRLNADLLAERGESVRRSLRAAVVTASLIDRIGRNIYAAQARIINFNDMDDADERQMAELAELTASVALNESRIQEAFSLYLQLHFELVRYDAAFITRELAAAESGLGLTGLDSFQDGPAVLARHQAEMRANRNQISEEGRLRWLDELDSQRAARRTQAETNGLPQP